MHTSAEQIYHGKLNLAPSEDEDLRLFVDLDICASAECKCCEVQCSYFYHPDNNGAACLLELATYSLVCRRCDEPHCVNACPQDALEQQPDKNKLLVRHTMRCVSCGSCSLACPYGTIYPEHVARVAHNCDFCLDRRDKEGEPLCVATCPHGALSLRKVSEPLDENTFLVGDNLIVHSTHWEREKV